MEILSPSTKRNQINQLLGKKGAILSMGKLPLEIIKPMFLK